MRPPRSWKAEAVSNHQVRRKSSFPRKREHRGARPPCVARPHAQLCTCVLRLAFATSLSRYPPDAPTHTPAAHTRPYSRPLPRKKRHSPAPPVSCACPAPDTHALHLIPTPAQFLPTIQHPTPPILPKLSQITRCAGNRPSRASGSTGGRGLRVSPAPTPSSVPASCASRSPHRLADIPLTPQRTPRPPTPGPIRARYPEKSVTLPPHPCPALAPPLTRTRSTSSPHLRSFSPPIRPALAYSPPLLKYPYIRAIIAHGRGGFQARPRDRPRGPVRHPRESTP